MKRQTRKLINIAYHRNGVMGEGFWVATFTDVIDGTKRNMMAVTFQEPAINKNDPIRTAVFDTDLLAKGDCQFGSNSWRGDEWHTWMLDQICEAQETALNQSAFPLILLSI